MIKKWNGKYFLTSLGGEIYSGIRIADGALSIFWKLKAVDAVMASCNLTECELSCIVDHLIDNNEIKNILKKIIIIIIIIIIAYHYIINQKFVKLGIDQIIK